MTRRLDPERRAIGAELVIPVLAVVFTLYFFTTIWNSPWTAQVSTFLIGGILLLVCGIFFIKCVVLYRWGKADFGMGGLVSLDDLRSGRLGLFLATIGYAVLIERFGFTLTTFAFLFVSMTVLSKGRGIGFNAALAAIISLAGWALFIWAFDTRFPRGWFETFMKAALNDG
jgi:tripartite tricarboxylate transporter TctB family protein